MFSLSVLGKTCRGRFENCYLFYIRKVKDMLEDLKEPIAELKENIMDVWGRL